MKVTRTESPGRQEVKVSFDSRDELIDFLADLDRQALAQRFGVEPSVEPIRTTAWVGEPQREIEARKP